MFYILRFCLLLGLKTVNYELLSSCWTHTICLFITGVLSTNLLLIYIEVCRLTFWLGLWCVCV